MLLSRRDQVIAILRLAGTLTRLKIANIDWCDGVLGMGEQKGRYYGYHVSGK